MFAKRGHICPTYCMHLYSGPKCFYTTLPINLYLFYIVWSLSGYRSSNKSYFSLIAQSYALGFYQIRVMTMLKKYKAQMAYAVIIALISFAVFIPSPKSTFSETADFMPAEFTDAERNWIEAHPVIYTAHDPVFAPYEYLDDTTYCGLAMDYLDWIEANYPLKFQSKQYETWSDALDALKTGAVDLLPAITETPQRKEFAAFTRAYIIVHSIITHGMNGEIEFVRNQPHGLSIKLKIPVDPG